MTRALILAAGQGTRLRPLTDDMPKALVRLLGRPLIEHQAAVLRACGIDDIRVVAGYRAEKLEATGLPVYRNPAFETTNMVASMMAAAAFIAEGEDLIVGYGDIVYQRENLAALLAVPGDIAVMVDECWRDLWSLRFADPLADAETLVLGADGRIVELGQKPSGYARIQGQYTGLFRVAGARTRDLLDFHAQQGTDSGANAMMYMTTFLQLLIDAGWDVRAALVQSGWLEVDSVEDLDLYERLAREGRLASLFVPEADR